MAKETTSPGVESIHPDVLDQLAFPHRLLVRFEEGDLLVTASWTEDGRVAFSIPARGPRLIPRAVPEDMDEVVFIPSFVIDEEI